MAEFIVNPRRSPRAPARCRAAVVSTTQGWFEAETEDIGAMGCQLVSPKLVRKGDLINIVVTNEKVEEPLKVSGRVAWVSPHPPWRVGVAFVEGSQKETARWFELLISAHPGLGGYRRVPDKIRTDASIYLGPPPKFLVDFTVEEATLLRAVGSGARVDELMSRLRDRWPAMQRALFSLIARQVVTFQRGQAVHPESWKRILSEIEASLAVEEMGKETPTVVAPPPPPFEPIRPARQAPAPQAPSAPAVGEAGGGSEAGRAHDPTRVVELQPDDGGTPLELAAPRFTPPPDYQGAGVGWRKAHARSGEAQAAFDRALAEIQSGSVNQAIALLRRALQLAPGDPEIAATLGRLAFKDRTPGAT